jgi:YbbR domain-containing protein
MLLNFFRNFKVKAVVFLLAVVLWFFVITESDYEHIQDVPITVINLADDKVILNDIPTIGKIKIKGSGKDLIALNVGRGARLILDLSGVNRKKTFRLEPRNVLLSRGSSGLLTTQILMPDTVTVFLDDLLTKKVPVVAKIQPKVAPGYTMVGEIELSQDSVEVTGPKSLLAQIRQVDTSDRNFTDLKFDLDEDVELASPGSANIELSIGRVHVFQDVQKLVEVNMSGIPVVVRNAPNHLNLYVKPSTLALVLEGGGELLASVQNTDVIAYLEYDRIKYAPENEHIPVVLPPPGISYRDMKPKTFQVVVEDKVEE